jgi:hypothetical protein
MLANGPVGSIKVIEIPAQERAFFSADWFQMRPPLPSLSRERRLLFYARSPYAVL